MTQESTAPATQMFGYGVVTSLEINELAAALAKAQGEITAAELAGEAKKDGKFQGYKYATLAAVWKACRVPLKTNGFSVLQPTIAEGELVGCMTLLFHTSGQWVKSHLLLPLEVNQRGVQAYGSVISYARRYSLAAMIGVAGEDDDGQAAVEATPPRQEPPRRRPAANRPQTTAEAPRPAQAPPGAPPSDGERIATGEQWKQILILYPACETPEQIMRSYAEGRPARTLSWNKAEDLILAAMGEAEDA